MSAAKSLWHLDSSNFSVETCILQLVNVSLEKEASSIAVRFDPKKRKIQVVDNGIGFSESDLFYIFNNKWQEYTVHPKSIFNKIVCSANAIIVTSRKKCSSNTFVKVVSKNYKKQKLFKGYHRPSTGTTITMYECDSSMWCYLNDQNYSIAYLMAAIAFKKLKVSFSLRNDHNNRVILNIRKNHNPWEVLKYLKYNEFCRFSYELISQTIQENKESRGNHNIEPFDINESLNSIKLPNEHLSTVNLNDKVNTINSDKSSTPLSEWSSWSYKPKIINNIKMNKPLEKLDVESTRNRDNTILSNVQNVAQMDENFINLSQMSVWSDWSYDTEKKNDTRNPRYKFLPVSIYKILPYKHLKILGDKNILQSNLLLNKNENLKLNAIIEKNSKCFQEGPNIRMCNMKRKLEECRINGNIINSLQILKQVNKEFIAAITNENGKKLLIMIDQHAVHERIRYEWLIDKYREDKTYTYKSVKLNNDLTITGIDENLLRIIKSHKKILTRVGINVKSIIDSTTCTVDAVPQCFAKRIKNYNHEYNFYRLIKNIRHLLTEVASGLSVSESVLPPVLPIAINNVIASEACHGAIKFGDPLDVKECTLLVQALQDTKAPTRCAHGRPSMIPLIDLSDLERRKFTFKKKLNFESLKNKIHATD